MKPRPSDDYQIESAERPFQTVSEAVRAEIKAELIAKLKADIESKSQLLLLVKEII